MRVIPSSSSIYLEEGEEWLGERQDPDNICRTSTVRLPTGCLVTVQRHFSQIGPGVYRPDGSRINTHVVDGAVVEWKRDDRQHD